MRQLLTTLGGKLLKNTGKGAPLIDSIRQIIVAIHEGKFDPKKLVWVLFEAAGVLAFIWVVLSISKAFGLTVDDILALVKKVMSLGIF